MIWCWVRVGLKCSLISAFLKRANIWPSARQKAVTMEVKLGCCHYWPVGHQQRQAVTRIKASVESSGGTWFTWYLDGGFVASRMPCHGCPAIHCRNLSKMNFVRWAPFPNLIVDVVITPHKNAHETLRYECWKHAEVVCAGRRNTSYQRAIQTRRCHLLRRHFPVMGKKQQRTGSATRLLTVLVAEASPQ